MAQATNTQEAWRLSVTSRVRAQNAQVRTFTSVEGALHYMQQRLNAAASL
jgi:hypothetical protein